MATSLVRIYQRIGQATGLLASQIGIDDAADSGTGQKMHHYKDADGIVHKTANLNENAVFNNVDVDGVISGDFIDGIVDGINTNTSDIATNAANIATNTSDIANLSSDAYLKSTDTMADIKLAQGDCTSLCTGDDILNQFIGRGIVEGFEFTDNLDGSATIGPGKMWLHTGQEAGTPAGFYEITGSTVIPSFTNNANTYLYVDYNGGSPIVRSTLNPTMLYDEDANVFNIVHRKGSTLHPTNFGYGFQSFNKLFARRSIDFARGRGSLFAERADGCIITSTGTRNIALEAGVFWAGTRDKNILARDTSGVDTFSRWYGDTANGFTEVSGQTQIDNANYWNGSALVPLTNNRYSVRYFFIDFAGDDMGSFIGTGNYSTLAEAEAESVPTDLPTFLKDFSELLGRVIVQQGSDTIIVESRYTSEFTFGAANIHAALGQKNAEPQFQHVNSVPGAGETGTEVSDAVLSGTSFKIDQRDAELLQDEVITTGTLSRFAICDQYLYTFNPSDGGRQMDRVSLQETATFSDVYGAPGVCAANGDLLQFGSTTTRVFDPNNNFSYDTLTRANGTAYKAYSHPVSGKIYFINTSDELKIVDPEDYDFISTDTVVGLTGNVTAIWVDAAEEYVYIFDCPATSGSAYIRKIDLTDKTVDSSSSAIPTAGSTYAELGYNGRNLVLSHDNNTTASTLVISLFTMGLVAVRIGTETLASIEALLYRNLLYTSGGSRVRVRSIPSLTTEASDRFLRGSQSEISHANRAGVTEHWTDAELIHGAKQAQSNTLVKMGTSVESVETTVPTANGDGKYYLISGGTSPYEGMVAEDLPDGHRYHSPYEGARIFNKDTARPLVCIDTGTALEWVDALRPRITESINHNAGTTNYTVELKDENNIVRIYGDSSLSGSVSLRMSTAIQAIQGFKFYVQLDPQVTNISLVYSDNTAYGYTLTGDTLETESVIYEVLMTNGDITVLSPLATSKGAS